MPINFISCFLCDHYQGERSCKAFGVGGIPPEIWDGENPHLKEFPGDNGFRLSYPKAREKEVKDMLKIEYRKG